MSSDLDPDDEHVRAAIDLHQRHLSDEQIDTFVRTPCIAFYWKRLLRLHRS
jgi:hypothetical protein